MYRTKSDEKLNLLLYPLNNPKPLSYPKVYTDGGCYNNGSKKAIAGVGIFWGLNSEYNVSLKIKDKKATNNVAELRAVIIAVTQAIQMKHKVIVVVTDCNYVIHGMEVWKNKWLINGWKTTTGKKVENMKEWIELCELEKKIKIIWKKVKAHTKINKKKPDMDCVGNMAADYFATMGMRNENPITTQEINKNLVLFIKKALLLDYPNCKLLNIVKSKISKKNSSIMAHNVDCGKLSFLDYDKKDGKGKEKGKNLKGKNLLTEKTVHFTIIKLKKRSKFNEIVQQSFYYVKEKLFPQILKEHEDENIKIFVFPNDVIIDTVNEINKKAEKKNAIAKNNKSDNESEEETTSKKRRSLLRKFRNLNQEVKAKVKMKMIKKIRKRRLPKRNLNLTKKVKTKIIKRRRKLPLRKLLKRLPNLSKKVKMKNLRKSKFLKRNQSLQLQKKFLTIRLLMHQMMKSY